MSQKNDLRKFSWKIWLIIAKMKNGRSNLTFVLTSERVIIKRPKNNLLLEKTEIIKPRSTKTYFLVKDSTK